MQSEENPLIPDIGAEGKPGNNAAATAHRTAAAGHSVAAAATDFHVPRATTEHAVSDDGDDDHKQAPPVRLAVRRRLHTGRHEQRHHRQFCPPPG